MLAVRKEPFISPELTLRSLRIPFWAVRVSVHSPSLRACNSAIAYTEGAGQVPRQTGRILTGHKVNQKERDVWS